MYLKKKKKKEECYKYRFLKTVTAKSIKGDVLCLNYLCNMLWYSTRNSE